MIIPVHCNDPDGNPVSMKYIGGDDWYCPMCSMYARYCQDCIDLLPTGVATKSIRAYCKHHSRFIDETTKIHQAKSITT